MVREQLETSLAGRYTIERELGRGGMATVFLARDLKHQRVVALKVLDPELGAVLGAERFLSEIRVTANLQHPNLLPLFDSGEADGLLYYVMPYVEGESLRARLEREKQLRVDEAVRIAVAVANALDYAHQHGVIHRDLKPENILIQAGQPVVADFGIALAVSNAGGQRVTQTGLSLGTPQYMSPEQATGDRAIDGRTDIYSLGAVLYEMLTGEPPHVGTTAQAVIARLMTEKPRPVRVTRETVPEHVELAVEIALAKLPADRFATASEFAHALEGQTATLRQTVKATAPVSRDTAPRSWRRLSLAAIPWVIAGAGVTTAAIAWSRPQVARHVGVFAVALPDSARLSEEMALRIAISRDGTHLAYVADARGGSVIYLRAVGDGVARPIAGTESGASVNFSPDGRWLLFIANGKLKKIPIDGGTPVVLADSVSDGVSWSDGDEIVFTRSFSLWKVPAAGGTPVRIAVPDSTKGQIDLRAPSFLPGGRALLVTVYALRPRRDYYLGVLDLATGKVEELGEPGASPRYASNGQIIFSRASVVFAAPFSLRSNRITGKAVRLFDGVSTFFGYSEMSVAGDGTLVYIAGGVGTRLQMVAVDRHGIERPLDEEPRFFSWPRVSPDGKRVAVEIGTGTGAFDVWLFDAQSKGFSRLTNNFSGLRPLGWGADGRDVQYIAVNSNGTGGSLGRQRVAVVPWDLSSPPRLLGGDASPNPEDASLGPAHGSLVVRLLGYGLPGDLSIAPLDTPDAIRPLITTPADEETPRVSPDGKLLAYASDETGQYEVYVRPIASGGGGRIQVSAGGGGEPVWTRDGRGLYYRGPTKMMFATVTATPQFAVVKRDTLFTDSYRKELKAVQYDAFPNGDLLMLKPDGRSSAQPVVVVNWPELLRQQKP